MICGEGKKPWLSAPFKAATFCSPLNKESSSSSSSSSRKKKQQQQGATWLRVYYQRTVRKTVQRLMEDPEFRAVFEFFYSMKNSKI
jgi:hypothetical protein